MKKLPLFFNLSGPSGIGKTTTLRLLMQHQRDFGLHLLLPIKITARSPKPTDNPEEMTYASQDEFKSFKIYGRLLADYERHGNRYGLLRPKQLPTGNQALIQTVPPAISDILKEVLADQFKIITIRLDASAEIVNARLSDRQDKISAEELASRKKTAHKPLPTGIDHVIDANIDPFNVAKRVAEVIKLHL